MLGKSTKLRRTGTPMAYASQLSQNSDESDWEGEFSFESTHEVQSNRPTRVQTPAALTINRSSDYSNSEHTSLSNVSTSYTHSTPRGKSIFSSFLSALPFGNSPTNASPSSNAIQRAKLAARSRRDQSPMNVRPLAERVGDSSGSVSKTGFDRQLDINNAPVCALALEREVSVRPPRAAPGNRSMYGLARGLTPMVSMGQSVHRTTHNKHTQPPIASKPVEPSEVPSLLGTGNPIDFADLSFDGADTEQTTGLDDSHTFRTGLVASVIAKMAQDEAMAKDLARQRQQQQQMQQVQRLRLLGQHRGDGYFLNQHSHDVHVYEGGGGGDNDQDQDQYFHYEKTLDPELLLLEGVLVDALQTLNLLEHEFGVYGDAFSRLGAQATKLSRTTLQVQREHQRLLAKEGLVCAANPAVKDEDEDESGSGSEDEWGLCDSEGRPLFPTQATVVSAGLEANTRTRFIRSQSKLSTQAHRLFNVQFKRELKAVAFAWRGECRSYESELKRAETHYNLLREVVLELEDVEYMIDRLRGEVSAGRATEATHTQLRDMSGQVDALQRSLHTHSVMYDGVVQGLKTSITAFIGNEGAINQFLELAMSTQKSFFKSSSSSDAIIDNTNQDQRQKLSMYASLMGRKKVTNAAPKTADFFFGTSSLPAISQGHLTPKRSDLYYEEDSKRYRKGHGPKRVDVSEKTRKFYHDCHCDDCVKYYSTTGSFTMSPIASLRTLSSPSKLAAIAESLDKDLPSLLANAIPPAPYIPELLGAPTLHAPTNDAGIPPAPYIPECLPVGFQLNNGIPPAPLLDLGMGSSPPPPSLAGLLGGLTAKRKTRQERDADNVERLGISAIPAADTLLHNIGLKGGQAKLKVVHWEGVDTNALDDTVWKDVARMLDPQHIDYQALLTRNDEEEEFVDEDLNVNGGDSLVVTQRRRTVRSHVPTPTLQFGLLTTQDIADISLLFAQPTAKPKRISADVPKIKTKATHVCLLDAKRAYAVNISLAQLKLSAVSVVDMVYSLSDTLPQDKLSVLMNIVPTTEEIGFMRTFKGDVAVLSDAERFFLTITLAETHAQTVLGVKRSVCHYEQCLKTMLFMREFADWARTISNQLDTVSSALMAIRDTPQTKVLLLAALSVGNILNCEHQTKSSVYGFKLTDLMKLSGIKANVDILNPQPDTIAEEGDVEEDHIHDLRQLSSDFQDIPMPKQPNLMHFICKLLMRRDPLLCSGLETAAEAFLSSSKLEQSALTSSVQQIGGHMKRVISITDTLKQAHEACHAILVQHNVTVQENGVCVHTDGIIVSSCEEITTLTIAKTHATAQHKLSSFIDYADLRVKDINDSLVASQDLGATLSKFLMEPDASEIWEIILSIWGNFLKSLAGSYSDILAEISRRETMRKRLVAAATIKLKRRNSTTSTTLNE